MRRRFFVKQFEGRSAVMRGSAAHHVSRVLRAEPGQVYELSDGERVWLGRIEQVSRDEVRFRLLEAVPEGAPSLEISLLLAIVKFDRFEWALEKAVELGATEVVPLEAARSQKALIAAAAKRAARWQKILLESAQQSRRLRPPALEKPARPREAFGAASSELKICLSERPDAPSLREVLAGRQARSATLAIGPEGGWTEEELKVAQEADFCEVSLGKTVLRTETAVLVALASLNYALGGKEFSSGRVAE
jgi:16S rRNA (uracil1498-N3)-methyltransferase